MCYAELASNVFNASDATCGKPRFSNNISFWINDVVTPLEASAHRQLSSVSGA